MTGRKNPARQAEPHHDHAVQFYDTDASAVTLEGGATAASAATSKRVVNQAVAKVARSASRDETRPVLTGILVSANGDELRMVATDSYRLSVKETKLEAPLEGRERGRERRRKRRRGWRLFGRVRLLRSRRRRRASRRR